MGEPLPAPAAEARTICGEVSCHHFACGYQLGVDAARGAAHAGSYVLPRPLGQYPDDEAFRRLGLDLMRAFVALGVEPGDSVLITAG